MRRRILVVTFAYLPSTAVGALRWSLMAKYLERLDYQITVLTSSAYGHAPGEDLERVVRTTDFGSMEALRRVLRRPSVRAENEAVAVDTPAPRLLTSVVVPDAKALSWAPFALAAAIRTVRGRGVDCVITTSPPDSAHLVGLLLRRLGPAWVADFRDGWAFEPTRRPFPTRLQRALDLRMEAAVVRGADACVAVTEGLVADLRKRLGGNATFVPNAWDPEMRGAAHDVQPPDATSSNDAPTLVYTGRLSFDRDRGPRSKSFLHAFARLASTRDAPPLQLVIAGRPSRSELEFLDALDCPAITHIGAIPRLGALRLQRTATALLVIGSASSAATAKVYEYLGADRPILHVGGTSAISRILDETGRGVTVPFEDTDAIIRELRRIANGEFGTELAPRSIERYSYPFVAERMAEVIEEATRRRATRR